VRFPAGACILRDLNPRVPDVPPISDQSVYELGAWRIDVGRRELRLREAAVPVGGRAFDILEMLVRAQGNLVTKSEIAARIWPGAIVEDNTLQVHISAIRRAFGQDRGLLKTESGRGYRLPGPWVLRQPGPSLARAEPAPPRPSPGNLPNATSPLVGRASAAQRLRELLSAYRAVTLAGPGGIGKTALALEVARSLAPDFQGDAWLVELAALSDPALVASAAARTLGLTLGGDEISPESVARAIGTRKLLLVLDNCEHVVDASALLAEALVSHCPQVTVLATSRELLRIDGEYVYRVPPLEVPTQREDQPGRILEHSAVQLFVARSAAFGAGCSAQPEQLQQMSAICRHLDGIPLAIELAAARSATLGLDQVAARLDDRFALLIGGRRTALPRHQTLRAALDWSFELLPSVEQVILRRLGVFNGGFTIQAACAVAAEPGAGDRDVIDGIVSLASKSLVAAEMTAEGPRHILLETVRAYALERLAEGRESDEVRRRHAQHFRRTVAQIDAGQARLQIPAWLSLCARELDNVRAALDWAFSPGGDSDVGIALTSAYVPVWVHLWLTEECNRRVEQALDRLEAQPPDIAGGDMDIRIALAFALMRSLGSLARVRPLVAAALAAAEQRGDADNTLLALWALFSFHSVRGEQMAALAVAARFAEVAGRTGDADSIRVGERITGTAYHYLGDQPRAFALLQTILAGYVPPADGRRTIWMQFDQRANVRTLLARVLWLQGRLDQAQAEAQTALAMAEANGNGIVVPYLPLVWAVFPIALAVGDMEVAEQSLVRLLGQREVANRNFWAGPIRCMAGSLLIRQGQHLDGIAALRQGLQACVESGWITCRTGFVAALAEGLSASEQYARAVAEIEQALEWSGRTGERWCDAELIRLKGELLLRQALDGCMQAAEGCFHQALEVARGQGALTWELRIAMSLARLRIAQDRSAEARQILAETYGRFTEGFETADLRAAGAMIGAL
jgi:predicted ATPase/DNA-binding winged helix-turn-helix (wHTH) protein